MSIEATLFLDALRKAEILPPDHLELYQDRLLRPLIAHARSIPFWASRLPSPSGGGQFNRADWNRIPVLSRTTLEACWAEMFAPELPAATRGWSEASLLTGSGARVVLRHSGLEAIAAQANMQRIFEDHRLEAASVFAIIAADPKGEAPYPFGMSTSGWYLNQPAGMQHRLDDATSLDDQAEWLARLRPAYLQHSPGALQSLALGIEHGQFEAWPLKGILSSGPFPSTQAKRGVEETFGVPVIEFWGTAETGLIAFQVPDGGMSAAAESILVEILDEDGKPLPAGRPGQLVLTPLYNYAMPLLRFAPGAIGMLEVAKEATWTSLPRLRIIRDDADVTQPPA